MSVFGARWLWILFTFGLSAFFMLQGLRHLDARSSHPPSYARAPLLGSAATVAVRPSAPDPHVILARNIFDPATGPLWPPPEPAETQEAEPEVPEDAVDPRCDTELRISASLYDARRPERSKVVLRAPNVAPRSYGPGMEVSSYTVAEIHPHAVRLDGQDGFCWIGMFTERSREKVARERAIAAPSKKPDRGKARARTRAPMKSARPAFSAAELDRGIRKLSETTFAVTEGLVDAAIARAARIASAASIDPVGKTGARGVRLRRLPTEGLLSRLGLKRGDVLKTINGYSLGNPGEALTAYSTLDRARRLTLAIKRGGRVMHLDYRIEDTL
jgi:general secretion pathway protein C